MSALLFNDFTYFKCKAPYDHKLKYKKKESGKFPDFWGIFYSLGFAELPPGLQLNPAARLQDVPVRIPERRIYSISAGTVLQI